MLVFRIGSYRERVRSTADYSAAVRAAALPVVRTPHRSNEFELIARYFAKLAAGFPGAYGLLDDAAVINNPMVVQGQNSFGFAPMCTNKGFRFRTPSRVSAESAQECDAPGLQHRFPERSGADRDDRVYRTR